MTTTTTFAWTRVACLKGGLRIFRDAHTGQLAVADGSGATPERTEDGVLWIDPKGTATLVKFDNWIGFQIAVSGPRRSPGSWVGADLEDAQTLFDLGLTIVAHEGVRPTLDAWLTVSKLIGWKPSAEHIEQKRAEREGR